MKNKTRFFSALGLLTLFMSILLAVQVAFAVSRTTVIVFCTEWNAKCRTAVPAIQDIVSSYNGRIDVQQFNIDLNTTPERARSLGINIPSKIPHVVVINRSGQIVFEQDYTSQTPTQLRSILNSMTE